MSEISKKLGELELEDQEIENLLNVFRSGAFALVGLEVKATQQKYLESIIQLSQKLETSGKLYELLLNDPDSFLKGLKALKDDRGTILVNIISSNKGGDQEKVVQNLLNTIRNSLKGLDLTKDTFLDVEYYLATYLSIISNFGNVSSQHLHILLKFFSPLPIVLSENGDSNYKTISSLVMLIVVKLFQVDKLSTSSVVGEYLELLYDDEKPSAAAFLNYTEIMETLFPLVPEVIEPIYISSKSVEYIKEEVLRILGSGGPELELPHRRRVCIGILKLIGSSCISDQSRTHNVTAYLELLKVGSQIKDNLEIRLLSTLDLIKLWNFIELEKKSSSSISISVSDLESNLTSYLRDALDKNNSANLEICVEGLAYLTLNVKVKQNIRSDESVIEVILKILSEKALSKTNQNMNGNDTSLIYGLLICISNLCKLQDASDKGSDKSTVNFLKDFATPNTSKDNTKEDQKQIHLFNKSLLFDHKVIDVISKLKTYKEDTDTPGEETKHSNLLKQFIYIIYMISQNPEKVVRQELVKQGALNVVLSYLIKFSSINKTTGDTRPINGNPEIIETRLFSLRSLAKMLVSINPALAFKKYDVQTCVPFLVELLGPDISKYSGSLGHNTQNINENYLYEMTNMDKYESLLALTNLSSGEQSKDLKQLIINRTFDKYLNNFIIDSDLPHLQKASWELISNLITQPAMLAKFFNIDDSKENYNRLDLLIKLINSTDVSFQNVIAGLLANATSEFDMISEILIKNKRIREDIIGKITQIFNSQAEESDLILRLSYILLNLVYAAANVSSEQLQVFSDNHKLKESVNGVLKINKNGEILQILIEVIKLVRFK
ncbi:protein required for mother cell-specific HO expression [Scheffersomyces xylosifermentans]|uniref:protein required for mother cell-specific HO expression n=1 Tax=Scheffersomyces xylosifermentans TaxID=1304137 RepID=UPI00315CB7C0